MKKFIAAISLLFIVASSFSQDRIPLIVIEEIQQQVANAVDKGDFQTAIEQLNQVSTNDSSYCAALTSKAYYLIQQKKFDETISVCEEGITKGCAESKVFFFVNKSVALLNKEDYTAAISVLDEAIKKYPNNYLLWYNKGVALENMDSIEEAASAYQRTIVLNPMYNKSHRQLGNLCYKQEKMAQALMCYNMYLFLDPDGEGSLDILKSLNALASANNENIADPGITISPDDASFEDMDIVLNQKIALASNYETGNKIDMALVRQNHALFQQLKDFKGNGGFWSQKYVPFYKWMIQHKQFDNFIYTLFYMSEDSDHKRLAKKNEDDIIQFVAESYVKWQEILSENTRMIDGQKTKIYNYYSDSYLQASGPMKQEVMFGSWELFNEDGQLTAIGGFNAKGEKEGKWTWFYPSGAIKEIAFYKNNLLEGSNKHYHKNGRLNIDATFLADELTGVYTLYNEYGALLQKKRFKDGKLEGMFLSYFPTGESMVEFEIPYKANEINGKLTEYYANGQVFAEGELQNGKKTGVELKYHINNTVYSEINYKDGEANGSYKTFWIDKTPMEVGQTVDGYYHGPWKSYHRNGTLETEFNYDMGTIDGLLKKYDTDGKLHYEYLYRKGEIIAYTFYNKAGEIIKEARKRGGEFLYTGYSPLGIQISQGDYDISGGKMGNWKFYTSNGTLSSEGQYEENKLEGPYTEYYKNGQKQLVATYVNDNLHGYYQSFYLNGQLYTHGNYIQGAEVGEWRTYFKDGTLKYINYYHEGVLNGLQQNFSVDGRLTQEYHYEFGELISGKFFDQEGRIFQEIDYQKKEDDYTLVYEHFGNKPGTSYTYKHGIKHGPYKNTDFYGNVIVTGSYLNGAEDGEWTWYHDNGKPRIKRNYVNGDYHGKATDYHENGTLDNDYLYEHGEATGTWLSYHENGTLYTSSEYRYNQYHGRKEFYSWNGKLQMVRFYDEGRLIGYSYLDTTGKEVPMIPIENETAHIKAYFDNGKISREMEYKNGQLVNKYKAYYYSGQLENELDYDANTYNGKDIEYYENGNLKLERPYLFDDLHGVVKEYYENGKMKRESNYRNDERNGITSYFDENGKLTKKEHYFNGGIYEVETF